MGLYKASRVCSWFLRGGTGSHKVQGSNQSVWGTGFGGVLGFGPSS